MIINLLWCWMVLGIVLVLLELAVSAFFLVWFGVGALIVVFVLLAVPSLSFAWQVLVWIICSVLFIWLWFKVFRPGFGDTRKGQGRLISDRRPAGAGS